MNKFVYVKRPVKISNTLTIDENEIGIFFPSDAQQKGLIFIVKAWQKVQLNDSDYEFFDEAKTGDEHSHKICNICHKLLPTIEFAKNQNGKGDRTVRRPSCQKCRQVLEGVNMSLEEKRKWDKLKPDKEPFECPICNKRTIAGVTSKIVLDHDHITGKGRGWICDSCNTGIGRFKDDVALLKKAIEFLESNPT